MPNQLLHYSEWETYTPQSDPGLAGQYLDSRLKSLAEQLSNSGTLKVVELRDGLSIQTFSHVGKISLGDLEVTINPKLPSLPLMDLLRYAFDFRSIALFPEAKYETDSVFQGLLVWQLILETKEILFRGLRKTYVCRGDYLQSPKGKIDFNVLARDGGLKGGSLYSAHFPRIEDNPINRVILSGLRYAAGITSDRQLRLELQSLIALLQPNISAMSLTHEVLRSAVNGMNRLTRMYEPAVRVISILYKSSGISLQSGASVILSGFLFDMDTFFQAFVSKFLRENLEGRRVEDEQRIRGMMEYVPGFNPLNKRPPAPRPDFVILDGNKTVAILDAKYRDLWKLDLPIHMLYQLCIYAMSRKDDPESIILYPCTSLEARDSVIQISDPISRKRMARVTLRPLNLLELSGIINRKGSEAERLRGKMAKDLISGPANIGSML